jgi:hypothetical protein
MAIPAQLTYTGDNKEFQFRDSFVMPLLLRLGFGVVVNYHGNREFGRDVIFGDIDRFGHVVYYGMQIKYESSISLSDSHELIQDAEQATHNPFRHPQTGREEYISSFYVANAGDISDQARENFFNTLTRRNIRDARLLDGPALLLLDRWASLSRGNLIRERINGLLMETRINRRVFSTLPAMMRENIEQGGPVPLQRARLNATASFLAAPVFSERINFQTVEGYYETSRLVNAMADEYTGTMIGGDYKKARFQGITQYAPIALSQGDLLSASLQVLLADVGPLMQ